MRFDIITIFPELFTGVLEYGILRRALQAEIVNVRIVNLRDFASDKHRSVDDRPYGGGEGMVFMPGPLFDAVEFCRGKEKNPETTVVLLSPQGKKWSQDTAESFGKFHHIILICGRYEGIDQRVTDQLVDLEISIGDFVLSGGEIPAMVILDSVTRLLPGVLGNSSSAVNESFSSGLLDCPHYTRPEIFRGLEVPKILLSGNHAQIEQWRKQQALTKTLRNRPEMVKK
jgi:tRNA (guanine37-N1)-methyltransferase